MLNIVKVIENSRFFSGISTASQQALADVCFVKELKKGETLFSEGEVGAVFYLLSVGNIQLHKTSSGGRSVVIKVLKPGEVFAEVILFEKKEYPVTAAALVDSTVLGIYRRDIHALLKRDDFRMDFIAMLMRKQRYLSEKISDLSLYDVEERFFLFLEQQYSCKETIYCPLSKKDVAAAIHTTPESLSRLLQRLKEDGVLTWDEKTILIHRPAKDEKRRSRD